MYSFGAAFSNLQWLDVGRCSFDASNACFRHLNYMHHRDLGQKINFHKKCFEVAGAFKVKQQKKTLVEIFSVMQTLKWQ